MSSDRHTARLFEDGEAREYRPASKQGALDSSREAAAYMREQIDAHPLASVGLAITAGFVVGGGLPRAAWTMLLGIGARFAAGVVSDEIEAAIQGGGSAEDGRKT